jgi:hypothetical protein
VPEIEFLLLADHAEAHNGKLTIVGGGWTEHRRQVADAKRPPVTHLGIGVGVLVPWTQTNRAFQLVVRLEDEDGGVHANVEGKLEVGRPAGLPQGSDQRAVFALNVNTVFPGPGGYRVVATIPGEGGTEARMSTVSFRVVDTVRQRPGNG